VTLVGTVRLDLTDVKPERMRNRLACLPEIPTGARVVIVVGPLKVEPEAARLIALHERRLMIDVEGMPAAVRRWLTAVRDRGEVLL